MIMLFIHIGIAVASVVLGVLILSLSVVHAERLMKYAAMSSGGTIATGVLLMILNPATIMHVCISGSIFTVFAIGAYLVARRRIAAQTASM